jgi:hypothetical protein
MRTDAEYLKEMAEIYGIRIKSISLPKGLLGKASAVTKTIYLDVSLLDNPRQAKCVLAEEIGHILFPPRPGHIRYHSKNFYEKENCSMIKCTVAQDERLARDWATNILLGNVDSCHIVAAGARSVGELADHFDVEPWLIEHRIGYLRRKARENGQKVKWRGLIRRAWMVKRSEAGQRISNIIRQNKIEHEKYKRKKMYEEIFDDLPIIILFAILPGLLIGYEVDILHGFAYGIMFIYGYAIGKGKRG